MNYQYNIYNSKPTAIQ